MKCLIAQQRNMRVLGKEIVDRRGPGFLHAGDDKIDVVDFATSKEVRLAFSAARFHAQ